MSIRSKVPPAGWRESALGEVCELITRGITPSYVDEGGVLVLNQKCIRAHKVDVALGRRTDASVRRVPFERFVKVGDVLVNSTGAGTLGRVAQVRMTPEEATTVDTHVTIVRPMPGLFDSNFFGYALIAIEDQLTAGGLGAVGQTELPRADIAEKFRVRFPESLEEQKRIVAKLDQAFAALERACANAEVNQIDAQEVYSAELESIFAGAWDAKGLGSLCEVFADGDWIESKDQSVDGVRLIQTGNIGQGAFKDRAEKARYISEATFRRLRCTEVLEGDCLISRLPDPVGRSCILPSTGKKMITAVDCTIVRFDTKLMLPTFFNHYAQSGRYFAIVSQKCTGTTRNRISRSNLAQVPVPVPSIPKQRAIVATLDKMREEVLRLRDSYTQKLGDIAALRQSLLQAAFSGQLT